MESVLVSVIVPVFNTEKYLRKCIESILTQTCPDIELILIDDGSVDDCPKICDEYALQDDRATVIHKPNGGPSAARNDGIKAASGEFILFVDSDDYIEPNAVEKLFKKAKEDNLDILLGAFVFNDNLVRIRYQKEEEYSRIWKSEEFLLYKLQQGFRSMVIWTGLYRRMFIIENSIFFKVGVVHEDELWLPSLYLSSGRLGLIKFPFYHYNTTNVTSIVRRIDQRKNGSDYLVVCESLEKLYDKIEEESLRQVAMDSLVQLYIYAVVHCRMFLIKNSKKDDNKFIKHKAYFKKTKLKVLLFSISRRLNWFLNMLIRRLSHKKRNNNSQNS